MVASAPAEGSGGSAAHAHAWRVGDRAGYGPTLRKGTERARLGRRRGLRLGSIVWHAGAAGPPRSKRRRHGSEGRRREGEGMIGGNERPSAEVKSRTESEARHPLVGGRGAGRMGRGRGGTVSHRGAGVAGCDAGSRAAACCRRTRMTTRPGLPLPRRRSARSSRSFWTFFRMTNGWCRLRAEDPPECRMAVEAADIPRESSVGPWTLHLGPGASARSAHRPANSTVRRFGAPHRLQIRGATASSPGPGSRSLAPRMS